MKAVSPIITVILILLILSAIIILFWAFLSDLFSETTERGETEVTHLTETISSCMKIESMSQNKLYLRNCAEGVITNSGLNVYINDEKYGFEMMPSSISKGEYAIISLGVWGILEGEYALRITNPETEVFTYFEAEWSDPVVLVLDFDEGEGNKAYDKSGYGNNGTLQGSTSWINGKYGNALEFKPISGDYVGVNDSESIRLRYAIQVEAWIKTADTSGIRMAIADRYTGSTLDAESGWLLFLTDDGKLRFHIGSSSSSYAYATGTGDLRDNQWHHVIGTYNKSVIQVFVDGNLEGYTMFSGDIWDGTSIPTEYGLNIGRRCDICGGSSAAIFNGIIDELKIYSNTTTPFKTLNFRMT